MKKILAVILILILSFSIASCSSCNDEGEHSHSHLEAYYEMGFHYGLPASFVEEPKLPYGDRVYKDEGGAYFYFNAFDGEELEEDWLLNPSVSVEDFTATVLGGLPFTVEFDYESSNDSTHFEYVWEYNGEEENTPSEYYRYMVIRSTDYVYVVTLVCNASDKAEYKEAFDDIINSIKLDEDIFG